MNATALDCRDERRRHQVRRRGSNGLDYLEVDDDQRTLRVYFLGPAPEGLGIDNVRIAGGRRIRDIRVIGVELQPQPDPDHDACMVVRVDRPGDFSTYTLCLVELPDDTAFDPRYRCLDFGFKVGCPAELDCRTTPACPAEPRDAPEIAYLAKDYASFRRLILDRLAVVMPEWSERHVPDLGITLVELLAYAGDQLSYHQDAVATEAYLGTARQRISVRRHARLVDYRMHEGCNARAWVHVDASEDVSLPAEALWFLTRFEDVPEVGERLLHWDDLRGVPAGRFEVFEPLLGAGAASAVPGVAEEDGAPVLRFRAAHNSIRFHTWGDAECCLPRGATTATLVDGPAVPSAAVGEAGEAEPDGSNAQDQRGGGCRPEEEAEGELAPDCDAGRVLDLHPGDVLIFEEVVGPRTGVPEDADPARRHAVRLVRVERTMDALYAQPVLGIEWAEEDALPFALCLSALVPGLDCALVQDISVARGNVLLADHGRRLDAPERLGPVAAEAEAPASCEREGWPVEHAPRPGRFRPRLGAGPLTFSQPLPAEASAAGLVLQDPRQALPWLHLHSGDGDAADSATPLRPWTARPDLLASGPDDDHYVVEMDDRLRAQLRFGDGHLGRRPDAGLAFSAGYRLGNGPDGNVGAEAIALVVTAPDQPVSGVTLVARNPMPARGGTAPEALAEVKLFAPHAFRHVRERAITAADYADLAGRHPKVQRAAAELRWNGSWHEVRVAVDPFGRNEAEPALLEAVRRSLHRYRRIGHDLMVLPARYVPLEIALEVCVGPGFLRGHVKAALLQRFGTGRLADGTPGFFHPDALSFGDAIPVSRLVAAAQAVPGVAGVVVARLERLQEGPNHEIEAGALAIGPLEIARLDNDPSLPEHGRIRFELRGGR